MTSMKCGVCGQGYEADAVVVLGHDEGLWFLSAVCSGCQTRALMAAVIEENQAPEVITDLTETELDKFSQVVALSVDDVLEMHKFLKDFQGDFSQLLDLK